MILSSSVISTGLENNSCRQSNELDSHDDPFALKIKSINSRVVN